MDPSRDELVSALKEPFDKPLPEPIRNKVLSQLPFVTIPGSFNARYLSSDLSLLEEPTQFSSSIKPNYVYRSGALAYLKSEGKDAIRQLGIKLIFDLRSEKERESEPDPAVEGVEAVWYPNTKDNITIIPDTKLKADGTLNVRISLGSAMEASDSFSLRITTSSS
jgi:hypothetical protein